MGVRCIGLILGLVSAAGFACDFQSLAPHAGVRFPSGKNEVVKTGLLIQPTEGRPILLLLPISVPGGHQALERFAEERFGPGFNWVWAGELKVRKEGDGLELAVGNETSGTAAGRGEASSIHRLRQVLEAGGPVGTRAARWETFKKGSFEHLTREHRQFQRAFEGYLEGTGEPRAENASHQIRNKLTHLSTNLYLVRKGLNLERSERKLREVLPMVLAYYRFASSDGFDVPHRRSFARLGQKYIDQGTLSPQELEEFNAMLVDIMASNEQSLNNTASMVDWITVGASAP